MIYLDHHAATPLVKKAHEAMTEAHAWAWANPSSVHGAGRRARASLEAARENLAQSLGAQSADLVWTSGGTEACNLGIHGVLEGVSAHAITSTVEHPAVAQTLRELEKKGVRITRLQVPEGQVPDASTLRNAFQKDTCLVALQWVNHETGTRFPIEKYAEVCAQAKVPFFVDATQALGKIPIQVSALQGVSALALASHKIGGPSGAGALWVSRETALAAQVWGGSQERGRRAGTPDTLACIGFGVAATTVEQRLLAANAITALRDALEETLLSLGAQINGKIESRVHTVTNVSLAGVRSETLIAALDLEGLCASSGAACSSGLNAPSAVVQAMYPQQPARAGSTLRLSLGPENTALEISNASTILRKVIERLQKSRA